jgi:hypothetical protein
MKLSSRRASNVVNLLFCAGGVFNFESSFYPQAFQLLPKTLSFAGMNMNVYYG